MLIKLLYKQIKNNIYPKLKYLVFFLKWRYDNQHNETIPNNYFLKKLVEVKKFTYGELNVKYWNVEGEKLKIGNFVSIGEGVEFILGGNHEINTFTTYPLKVMLLNEKKEAWTKGPIIIKDDVWIGTGALVLSGVTIEQGAIVAARSVVTKNVPAYSIVAGNPARVIKYRYSKEIIDEMLEFDWSKIDLNKIEKLKKELNEPLTLELVKKIKKEFGEN